MRRAARGDQDAFAAIFRRYEQDLYRYCVAIVGDRQDAQDALQNTMVKALRALPGERRQIELKPWLYRVAHNESIELRRRARPSEPLIEEMSAPVASLEETAAERGRLRHLLADIGELSERHRGALVMRELGGLDFDAIGVALDTTPAAARQVLYEARRGLQQMSDGREMNCEEVTLLLSDGDGRVGRRRDVRAHLRDCSDCRGFADGIRERTETLAGIAPLPAIAAAAIAKGALAGSGGAVTGAAGGGAVGASGASLAGGAVAKVASTGAILKSTVAIVAVVGAGAVAIDHSSLLHHGTSPESRKAAPGSVAEPARGDATAGSPTSRGTERGVLSRYIGPTDSERVDLARARTVKRMAPAGQVGAATPKPRRSTPRVEASTAAAVSVPPSDTEPSEPGPSAVPPQRPDHPASPVRAAEPSHPEHPVHPEHPSHPSHPSKPVATPAAEPPVESEPKPEPASPSKPPKVKSKPEPTAPPESSDEASIPEATEPEEPETGPEPKQHAEPPGQAKK